MAELKKFSGVVLSASSDVSYFQYQTPTSARQRPATRDSAAESPSNRVLLHLAVQEEGTKMHQEFPLAEPDSGVGGSHVPLTEFGTLPDVILTSISIKKTPTLRIIFK